jgi:hypothetical protein
VQNRAAGPENESGEPAPKTYSGTVEGLKEAGREIMRRRQEAEAPGLTPDDVAAADAEHHQRVAQRMDVPGVDLNKIVLTKPDEPLTARNAGKLLSEYHQQRNARAGTDCRRAAGPARVDALEAQQQAASQQ